jgi:hypothetical protein
MLHSRVFRRHQLPCGLASCLISASVQGSSVAVAQQQCQLCFDHIHPWRNQQQPADRQCSVRVVLLLQLVLHARLGSACIFVAHFSEQNRPRGRTRCNPLVAPTMHMHTLIGPEDLIASS